MTGNDNERLLNLDLQDKFQRLKGKEQYNIVSESSASKERRSSQYFNKSKSSLNFYSFGGRKVSTNFLNAPKSDAEMAAKVFNNEAWFQQLTRKRNEQQEQMTQRIRGTYDKMAQQSEKYQSVRLTSQLAKSKKELMDSSSITDKQAPQKLWKNAKFIEIQEEGGI